MERILHRSDKSILYQSESAMTQRGVLLEAIRFGVNLGGAYLGRAYLGRADFRGADLGGAYLGGAYLDGADLSGADLSGADLSGADLSGADLSGADLSGAYLSRADLCGANLGGAKINWQSHDLIAEILRSAAGMDVGKRMIAGLILVSRDWCWDDFVAIDSPHRDWTIKTLAQYVISGDNSPEILRL